MCFKHVAILLFKLIESVSLDKDYHRVPAFAAWSLTHSLTCGGESQCASAVE